MDKTKILEKRKDYLKLAVKNMPEEVFLDSYWNFLADTKKWISSSTKEVVSLKDMDENYLYNIRNMVMSISGKKPQEGTIKFIGLLTSLMNEKANEKEEKAKTEVDTSDLPF